MRSCLCLFDDDLCVRVCVCLRVLRQRLRTHIYDGCDSRTRRASVFSYFPHTCTRTRTRWPVPRCAAALASDLNAGSTCQTENIFAQFTSGYRDRDVVPISRINTKVYTYISVQEMPIFQFGSTHGPVFLLAQFTLRKRPTPAMRYARARGIRIFTHKFIEQVARTHAHLCVNSTDACVRACVSTSVLSNVNAAQNRRALQRAHASRFVVFIGRRRRDAGAL